MVEDPPQLSKAEDEAARELNREKRTLIRQLDSMNAKVQAFADGLDDAHDFAAKGYVYDTDTRTFVKRPPGPPPK